MKRLMSLLGLVLVVFISLPACRRCFAQSPAKTFLSQVPITYAGDTADTIKRRVQMDRRSKKRGTAGVVGNHKA